MNEEFCPCSMSLAKYWWLWESWIFGEGPNPWLFCRYAALAAKSLHSCPTLRPQRRQPTRLPCPWDSPGKNTGVGCHFLLQCMKVKSEREVTQSCLTLRDPMDRSPPGSSAHGILQARALEWGAITFSTPKIYLLSNIIILLHISAAFDLVNYCLILSSY